MYKVCTTSADELEGTGQYMQPLGYGQLQFTVTNDHILRSWQEIPVPNEY